jgi:hypothetical protein
MCEDCNPIESNTGVIQYSGPNLVICNGNTITNGELLTSVIAKIDNCIGALQNQLDFTGLVENSPCINLTKTSLQTVLQSILDTESTYCTQLQNLNTQLTNLQNQVNSLILTKPVTVTACDPSRVTFTPGTAVNTFKLNGLVPPKTILPYFGVLGDFDTTGLGIPNTATAGWAIANGQNGTINVVNQFIRYSSTINSSEIPSGANNVTLGSPNIPATSFNVNANFDLDFTGETDLGGNHRHQLQADDLDASGHFCGNLNDGIYNGDPVVNAPVALPDTGFGSKPCQGSRVIGPSGEHSHTFTINSTATGSFSAIVGSTEPESFSIIPSHIQAIPIQWVGCV